MEFPTITLLGARMLWVLVAAGFLVQPTLAEDPLVVTWGKGSSFTFKNEELDQ